MHVQKNEHVYALISFFCNLVELFTSKSHHLTL